VVDVDCRQLRTARGCCGCARVEQSDRVAPAGAGDRHTPAAERGERASGRGLDGFAAGLSRR
jgi:hypothetical protein